MLTMNLANRSLIFLGLLIAMAFLVINVNQVEAAVSVYNVEAALHAVKTGTGNAISGNVDVSGESVSSVQVELSGSGGIQKGPCDNFGSTSHDFYWSSPISFPGGYSDGIYAATMKIYTDSSCASLVASGSDPQSVILDNVAPSLFGSRDPNPNPLGWNNSNVTASFTCLPGSGSDLKPNQPSHNGYVFGQSGQNQSVTSTCEDEAGNIAQFTIDGINIDKTKPVINGNRSPGPNSQGWNNANVDVGFSCAESGTVQSGIQTDTVSGGTISSEGQNQQMSNSGTCVDNADNVADSNTVTGINIDKTGPSYGGPSRAVGSEPNGSSWNNGNVTVNFPCNDGLSGAVIDPVQKTLMAEGAGQTASVLASECVDLAGNMAASGSSLSSINIDKTAPDFGPGSRAVGSEANGNGWNNGNVTVEFPCSDSLSGPVAPQVQETVTSEGWGQTASVSASQCVDLANNVAASGASLSRINIDLTDPSVTTSRSPEPNGNGWNDSSVTISYSCSDGLSGVAVVSGDDVLSSDGANQSATGSCQDEAGNLSSTTVSSINIDRTLPIIVINTPSDSAVYQRGTSVVADYTATDFTSGLESLIGTAANGAAIDTSTVGEKTFSVTTRDLAGNEITVAHSYRVIYVAPEEQEQTIQQIEEDVSNALIEQSGDPSGEAIFVGGSSLQICFAFNDPTTGEALDGAVIIARLFEVVDPETGEMNSIRDLGTMTFDAGTSHYCLDFDLVDEDSNPLPTGTYAVQLLFNDGTLVRSKFEVT